MILLTRWSDREIAIVAGGFLHMYHFIEDKEFLKRMRGLCSNIINELVQLINSEDYLTVEAHLVGSGAKNLETQNAKESIDLDYNLNIISVDGDINECEDIKEYVRKAFNEVLNRNGWSDCQDSTSALTTERRHFTKGNGTEFSIDLAIVSEDNDESWYRLIHEKTGFTNMDRYFWNQGPDSKGLTKKVNSLKKRGLWNDVRECYLNKKNLYLSRRDNNHPSFNCYIEAVNEIYNSNI